MLKLYNHNTKINYFNCVDSLIDFNDMSRVILCLEVKELHTMYIYIFCVVAKEFFVHSYLISSIPI